MVDAKSDDETAERYNAFHFLADQTATDSSHYVGSIRVSEKADLAPMDVVWRALRGKAMQLGGNAFKVTHSIGPPDSNLVIAELDVFEVSDSLLEENENHFSHNKIYVFGRLFHDEDPTDFKLNDQPVSIAPLQYVTRQNEVGGETTIAKGGFFGMKLTVKGRKGRPPSYWSLGGFRMHPTGGPGGGMGVGATTGRVHPVDPNFGRFLVRTLTEQDGP